jgi:3-oxoacyl-[acyl-carrier-protein] synthase II
VWAITGTGMVSSLGMDKETNFTAFCRGETGNQQLHFFNQDKFNLARAYQILIPPFNEQETSLRATQWLCTAINEAIQAAQLSPSQTRLAILIGTGLRELRSLELWWADGQPLQVKELHFAQTVHKTTGLECSVITLSNACSASLFALALAEDMLLLGQVDTVIVAGCDSITESMFGLLDRVNSLHPEEVQPFQVDRRGVLLGEGAAALVLETEAYARQRGITPCAWLRGVGTSCDAYHETAPDPEGIAKAIQDAHTRAQVVPEEIDLLMVHGTGTILNDQAEALALSKVFEDKIYQIPITGLKSLIGHTSGASGLIGVVTAIECLNQRRIPPTRGFTTPSPQAEGFDIVVGEARPVTLNIAQVNAFGFGGINAVSILERAV